MDDTQATAPRHICADHEVTERDTFFIGINKVPAKVQRQRCRVCNRVHARKEQVAFNQRNVARALKTAKPGTWKERDVLRKEMAG